jgi:urease accessory protein
MIAGREPAPGGAGSKLAGHLFLVCAADDAGRSHLRQQSFSAPIHISKPHLDQGTLVVNVVNPTAGWFSGDRVECDVAVETGARLLLTSPGAARAHKARGETAMLDQRMRVAAGGFLEVLPELFIPQAGADFRQRTAIEMEEGGELLFGETLAPGRVASGEAFAFARVEWETSITLRGRRIARERYSLKKDDASLVGLRTAFPASYYGAVFAIGPAFEQEGLAKFAELQRDGVWIGGSRLTAGGWVVKLLAADSVELRAVMHAVRELLFARLGRPAPGLRRV